MITLDFSRKLPLISEITLLPITWKAKSATTHWECLCPARIIVSPFGHWPATRVFPGRDPSNSSWTACIILCPQNLNNLKRAYNSLSIPDPEWSPFVRIRIICSHWMQVSHQMKVCNDYWKNIRTSLEIIHTGSEILIPDPKSSGSSNNFKNLFICFYSIAKLRLLICVWRIRLWSRSEWLIDFLN